MPNPSPKQTEEFLEKQFKAQGDLPPGTVLAGSPLCVKLPVEADEVIRNIPNKTAWLRNAIIDAARRDGLLPEEKEE